MDENYHQKREEDFFHENVPNTFFAELVLEPKVLATAVSGETRRKDLAEAESFIWDLNEVVKHDVGDSWEIWNPAIAEEAVFANPNVVEQSVKFAI